MRAPLRDALDAMLADGRELEVHYQPILALADGRIQAVEALARWRHPQRGWIPPDVFVPLAERSRRIVRLGQHVLDRAAGQIAAWRSGCPGSLPLGVLINLSQRELAEPGYVPFLADVLAEHGIAPADLGFELTERVFIDGRNPWVARNLSALAERGHRLVLDDFGTGYSALASLKRFPLHALKIDKLFIGAIVNPDDEAPITRAVVSLGQSLGLVVIAEGIETPLQLSYLSRLGCDAAQGYLFGRPQPADDITTRLGGTELAQPAAGQMRVAGLGKTQTRARRSRDAGGPVRVGALTKLRAGELNSAPTALDLLFEDVSAGVISVDLNGVITHVNPTGCRELGFSEQELIGADARQLLQHTRIDGSPCPQSSTLFESSLGTTEQPANVLWRKDGSFFEVASTLLPIAEDGVRVGNALLFNNVSIQRSADREMRRSRDVYRTLVENSSDLISLVELDGTIRFLSRSYERVLGYSVEKLIGEPFSLIADTADAGRLFELVARALAGKQSILLRSRLRHSDGSFVPVESSVAIVRNADGAPLVLSTSRDLSARVLLEAQLLHAQKLEAIGQLTAGVAHDFENLLLPMRAFGDLALAHVGDEQSELRLDIEQMQAAGQRAGDLIHQLRAASQHGALAPRLLQMDEVVSETLPLIALLLGVDVELSSVASERPTLCTADPGSLSQVLLNLATNARDALSGHGHVTITTGHHTLRKTDEALGLAPGEYVTLRVADSGCGMDAETQARIFEPFFTTKAELGTGLGLATVHGIVRELSGAIEVESAPGLGTSFTISLPAAESSFVDQ